MILGYEDLSRVLGFGSIVILLSGIIAALLKGKFKKDPLPFSYLVALILLELSALYLSDFHNDRVNIFLLYFSGFVHLLGVILIVDQYYNPEKSKVRLLLIPIGLILLFQSLYSYTGFYSFQVYGNVLYNLFILSFSLSYFIRVVLKGIKPQKHDLILNSAILLYFSFDSVISLSSNFLINEHLNLVAPFWLIRTALLQLFYLSLIHFSWQIGKTLKR